MDDWDSVIHLLNNWGQAYIRKLPDIKAWPLSAAVGFQRNHETSHEISFRHVLFLQGGGITILNMVFSLKNIDDAGFGLRDSSKLGNLLHRKWRENHEQAELVNVWGSCGHVFVTTNKGRNLHAFESVPRSKWTPESEGLLLQGKSSSVLDTCEILSLVNGQ